MDASRALGKAAKFKASNLGAIRRLLGGGADPNDLVPSLAAVVATAVFRPALLAARLRPLQLAVRPSPVSRRGVRQGEGGRAEGSSVLMAFIPTRFKVELSHVGGLLA